MNKWFIIFAFMLSACSNHSYRISEKEKLANKNLSIIAKELARKYELKPMGSGGQMMDEIKMLHLAFAYSKPLTVDKARPMIMGCVNTFSDIINKDENIRKYLVNFPFTSKNIELEIYFHTHSEYDVCSPELLLVSMNRGKIKYKIKDPFSEGHLIIFEETFEQAEKYLRAWSV